MLTQSASLLYPCTIPKISWQSTKQYFYRSLPLKTDFSFFIFWLIAERPCDGYHHCWIYVLIIRNVGIFIEKEEDGNRAEKKSNEQEPLTPLECWMRNYWHHPSIYSFYVPSRRDSTQRKHLAIWHTWSTCTYCALHTQKIKHNWLTFAGRRRK